MATQSKPDREQQEQTEEQKHGNEEGDAARTIQRNYRGYKSRREQKGCGISAEAKWMEVLNDARFHNLTDPKMDGDKPRTKWFRATGVADRLNAGEDEDSDAEEPDAQEKEFEYYRKKLRAKADKAEHTETMGLVYWLELVDHEHRYGYNLLQYHKEWTKSDSKEKFFYWLDEGEGKSVDLEGTSRERLEKQKVKYLTREERYKYLINVGDDGLLRWAKNGEKVTTHAPEKGAPNAGTEGETETNYHATADLLNTREVLKEEELQEPAAFTELVKHMPANANWIFVVDTMFRIYAGIKQPGGFNHSSFLHGSRVLSAGRISIQDGYLRSLSPHSGHYRPKAENFWITAKCLEAAGVNMSQASIRSSYAILRATELYTGAVKSVSSALGWGKKEEEKDG